MSFFHTLAGAAVFVLLLAAPAWSDEAIRTDGRHVVGTLAVEARGHLRFTPKGQAQPLPTDGVQWYRFDSPPVPCRFAAGHRVVLADSQHFTAQLLDLDAKNIRLRTTWADRIVVPRAAVVALTQVPGQRTLFEDDLTKETPAWSIAGKPTFAEAVVLSAPGQTLTYKPPKAVAAGHFGVNFETRETTIGAHWLLEATFAGAKDPRRLSVLVAGPGKAYQVEANGLDGVARDVSRTAGLHRITVRFHAHALAVLCDDEVLWHNVERGSAGPLQSVRLACVEGEKSAETKGGVAWSAFALIAAANELRRPPGDPTQDEIWLAEGDQVFGTIVRADRNAVTLRGSFGERTFPWSTVRGCFFRGSPAVPHRPDGESARVLLHAPNGGEPDVLRGVIKRLDDKTLTLRHAELGDLTLERGRVKEVRP